MNGSTRWFARGGVLALGGRVGYVAAWNAVTRFDLFKGIAFNRASGGVIVSMLRAIRTWVLGFARFIEGNEQPDFARFRDPEGDFRMSLSDFEDRA